MRIDEDYDPETQAMLAQVFERAWDQVRTLHSVAGQPQNAQEARDELAKRIAQVHANGERDPQTIELIALRAFSRWAPPARKTGSG